MNKIDIRMNVINNHFTGNFTIIPNALIHDSTLSDRSRFMYIYLLHKPQNWEFRTEHLSKCLGMHKDTFRKYRKELCDKGWIEVEEQKNVNGNFKTKVYHLYGEPVHSNEKNQEPSKVEKGRIFPSQKISATENYSHGKNQPHNNKDYIIKKKIQKKRINKIEEKKNSNFQNPNPR